MARAWAYLLISLLAVLVVPVQLPTARALSSSCKTVETTALAGLATRAAAAMAPDGSVYYAMWAPSAPLRIWRNGLTPTSVVYAAPAPPLTRLWLQIGSDGLPVAVVQHGARFDVFLCRTDDCSTVQLRQWIPSTTPVHASVTVLPNDGAGTVYITASLGTLSQVTVCNLTHICSSWSTYQSTNTIVRAFSVGYSADQPLLTIMGGSPSSSVPTSIFSASCPTPTTGCSVPDSDGNLGGAGPGESILDIAAVRTVDAGSGTPRYVFWISTSAGKLYSFTCVGSCSTDARAGFRGDLSGEDMPQLGSAPPRTAATSLSVLPSTDGGVWYHFGVENDTHANYTLMHRDLLKTWMPEMAVAATDVPAGLVNYIAPARWNETATATRFVAQIYWLPADSGGSAWYFLNQDGDIKMTGCDNCPTVTNKLQLDSDSDGIGNNCNCNPVTMPANDGNRVGGDGCSATCTVELGYQCTVFNPANEQPSICSPWCGDGLLIGGQECDDNNTASGDGCSSSCEQERGWSCTGAPSVCNSTCGDGIRVGHEQCDDDNVDSGDGCSPTCTVDFGWKCAPATGVIGSLPDTCVTVCGDGLLAAPLEECDDGNEVDNDGCSATTCTVDIGYQCSGTAPSVCDLAYLLAQDTFVDADQPDTNHGEDASLEASSRRTMLLMFNATTLLQTVADSDLQGVFVYLQLQCGNRTSAAIARRLQIGANTAELWDEMSTTFATAQGGLYASLQGISGFQVITSDSAIAGATTQLLLDVTDWMRAAVFQQHQPVFSLALNFSAAASSGDDALDCLSADNSDAVATSRLRSGSGTFAGAPSLRFSSLQLDQSTAGGGGGSDGGTLSGGAIAGVVIGVLFGSLVLLAVCCLLAALVVAAVVLLAMRRRKQAVHSLGGDGARRNLALASLEANAYCIDAADLKMVKLLGRGATGQVYSGTWQQGRSSTEVAIKRITAAASMSQGEVQALQAESDMLARLHHPNVMRFYGIATTHDDLLLVCELMHKGSLEALLQQSSDPLPPAKILSYAIDATRGLVYLHHERIVHRDIKPANVLISADDRVKLGDFGIARERKGDSTMTAQGTPVYMAPEVCRNLSSASFPLDIYSLGVVFWELAARQRPFATLSAAQVVYQVTQGMRPDAAKMHPVADGWAALVQQCWAAEPADRPTAELLLERLVAMQEQLS